MHSSTALATAIALIALPAFAFEGDAYRGAGVLEKQHCTRCHSVQGQGGKSAPDLGIRTSRQYTPAMMASVMWNHAPRMWSAMRERGIERPQLDERAAEDLFAYFYSVRFFDKPGNAERGKRVFETGHCIECHALDTQAGKPGKPIRAWDSMADPVVLVQQMWNHSSLMKSAFKSKNYKWTSLTGQDLNDLSIYLQNLPQMKNKKAEFWLPNAGNGEALFGAKGCAKCHHGGLSPEYHMANQTLADVAADMWNHAPRMENPPVIAAEEMRQILTYVWEKQYLGAHGNAAHGKAVFEKKNCAGCHNDPKSGAPRLSKGARPYSSITMVSSLWKHGPAMLAEMRKRNVPWPQFTPGELSDVTAYLNSRTN